jgi:hypothetical protein
MCPTSADKWEAGVLDGGIQVALAQGHTYLGHQDVQEKASDDRP